MMYMCLVAMGSLVRSDDLVWRQLRFFASIVGQACPSFVSAFRLRRKLLVQFRKNEMNTTLGLHVFGKREVLH
jgi:hypothetical protein